MTQTATAPEARTQAENLDLLAAVAVNVGLGLKPGQELVMTASLDSVALARRITEHAYRAGASLVTTLLNDEEAALHRCRHSPGDPLAHERKWPKNGRTPARKSRAARRRTPGAK